MWCENQAGEFYWPLHPARPQDHLRVWQMPRGGGWCGAIVLDGDYTEHLTPPRATSEEAREAIYAEAREALPRMAEQQGDHAEYVRALLPGLLL